MKLTKKFFCSLSLLLLTAQPGFSEMKTSGINDKLEWGVVRELQLPSNPIDIAHSLDGRYIFVLTKNNEVRAYNTAGKLQGTIPVDEGVTSIELDPRAQYLHLSNSDKKKLYTLEINFVVQINSDNSPTKGKKNAPITIAVYSDFQ